MKSSLLKICRCHLLTYLGRSAQLALWKPSHVYGKDSLAAIIKVSKSVSALCKLSLLSQIGPPLYFSAIKGRAERALRRDILSKHAHTQHRSQTTTTP